MVILSEVTIESNVIIPLLQDKLQVAVYLPSSSSKVLTICRDGNKLHAKFSISFVPGGDRKCQHGCKEPILVSWVLLRLKLLGVALFPFAQWKNV